MEASNIQLTDFETKEDSQSLYKVVKDNPKDKIEVEIGDSKDLTTFQPQAKIMRWDNEVNLSVRYKDSDTSQLVADSKEDVVEWIKSDKEVHIYEKPEIDEDGGLEIEVVLKEKPISNVVEFSIQTKGLDFFYQPPLTEENLKEGQTATETQILNEKGEVISERPENVVGSYAVYYKDNPANVVGGKEYKVGKLCHIFRPEVIDAKGNKIWGELNVDTDKGLLTVTIDEKWLGSAVYPVIVDPTFGYTSIGASEYSVDNNQIGGYSQTITGEGSITSLSVYARATIGTRYCQLGLYEDATGLAGNKALISHTSDIAMTTTSAWYSGDATGDFTSDNRKILGFTSQKYGAYTALRYDSGTGNYMMYVTATYGTWPDPANFNTSYTYKFSIYATYTEASSGTEASSERGLYTKGKIASSSTRSVYTKGKSSNSSSRSVYTKAKATNSSTRSVYTKSSLSGSSKRDLYTKGISTSSSERSIYTKGIDTTSSERNIYSIGSVGSSSERGIHSIGGGVTSSERSIHTTGSVDSSSERSLYSKGIATTNSERSVHTTGSIDSSSERNLYSKGVATSSSERSIYSKGSIDQSSERNVYSKGIATSNSERNIHTTGSVDQSSERDLYTKGISTNSSERNVHTTGSLDNSSERGIYSSGKVLTSSTRNIHTIAVNPEGQEESSRSIYTKGIDTDSSERSIHSVGGGVVSSERAIHTLGEALGSSQRGVYTIGSETDSSERDVYTKAKDTSSSERGVYTEGDVGNFSERSIYTKGIDTGSSERGLYTKGRIDSSSERLIHTTAKATTSSERGLYTKGASTVAKKFKRYNGTAWVDAALKRYNGSSWEVVTLKRYNSSTWEDIP